MNKNVQHFNLAQTVYLSHQDFPLALEQKGGLSAPKIESIFTLLKVKPHAEADLPLTIRPGRNKKVR